MTTSRWWTATGLLLAACTSNPPVQRAAPEPEVAPVVPEPPVVPDTPPEPAPPPVPTVPLAEPGSLTVHAVVIADATVDNDVAWLPSGHVLFRDDYHFMVYPVAGAAATELRGLPPAALHSRFVDDESDGRSVSLETLHGAWPDLLYATTELAEMRGETVRRAWHWGGDAWAELASPGTDRPYELTTTYERLLPWVKGRYLVERALTCSAGCPVEPESYEEGGEMSREDRKLMREIDRKIERFKPFAVLGGKPTALPELPDDGYPFDLVATATGDVWLPRRSGAVDHWNLTTRSWRTYAGVGPRAGALVATSSGAAAYYGRCEPGSLVYLSEGTVTDVPLPEAHCVRQVTVDHEDRPWLVMRDANGVASPAANRLWRRQGELWQKVEVTTSLPGGSKGWSFDGSAWVEVEVPKGEYRVAPIEVLVRGPDEVWVYGTIREEGLVVLARAQGGPGPFDLRAVPLPLDDLEGCEVQYVRLGTLAAGVDPATAWAGVFKYLAALSDDPLADIDDPEAHVYEVEEDGERAFYVTFGELSSSSRAEVQTRLAALLSGVSELQCGISPQPTREHALPEPSEAPVDAHAGAARPAVPLDLKGAMEARTDAPPSVPD